MLLWGLWVLGFDFRFKDFNGLGFRVWCSMVGARVRGFYGSGLGFSVQWLELGLEVSMGLVSGLVLYGWS